MDALPTRPTPIYAAPDWIYIHIEALDVELTVRPRTDVSLELFLDSKELYRADSIAPTQRIFCDWGRTLPRMRVSSSSHVYLKLYETGERSPQVLQVTFPGRDLLRICSNIALQPQVLRREDDFNRMKVTLCLASDQAVGRLRATQRAREGRSVQPPYCAPPNRTPVASLNTYGIESNNPRANVVTNGVTPVTSSVRPAGASEHRTEEYEGRSDNTSSTSSTFPSPSLVFQPEFMGGSVPLKGAAIGADRRHSAYQTPDVGYSTAEYPYFRSQPGHQVGPTFYQQSPVSGSPPVIIIQPPSHSSYASPEVPIYISQPVEQPPRVSTPPHPYSSHVRPTNPYSPYSPNSNFLRNYLQSIYLGLLLTIPAMYSSRVSKLFVMPGTDMTYGRNWHIPTHGVIQSTDRWPEFVLSVIKEWKTLNVVSALFLSAILTTLQISDAANEVVTRTAALLSLIASLWSLSFGCVYVMRFGTMNTEEKAQRWAAEARKNRASIFWNVWVMLAMPAVWLAWSVIAFCVSILTFIWTTGSNVDQPSPPSKRVEMGTRVAVTALFALGILYFVMVMHTFRSYSSSKSLRAE